MVDGWVMSKHSSGVFGRDGDSAFDRWDSAILLRTDCISAATKRKGGWGIAIGDADKGRATELSNS